MTEVKTFVKARKLSIDKWEKILEKISELENLMGGHCGFCLLGDYEVQQTGLFYKCSHCLVESKCQECKDTMSDTINKAQIWIEENLIPWLENLKEKDTTSRYLELKKKGFE